MIYVILFCFKEKHVVYSKPSSYASHKSFIYPFYLDDDDNLAVETQNDVAATAAASAAPYARLPQSYQNILPASFYATHTFVPPIKNLYSIETTDG